VRDCAVVGVLGVMQLDSDIVILDKGCRARRQAARAGTRGRRGARRVAPCPLYVVTVKGPRMSDDERKTILETVERY
jgi:hypothetical protein